MALGKIQEKKEKSKVIIDMCRGGGTLPRAQSSKPANNSQTVSKEEKR